MAKAQPANRTPGPAKDPTPAPAEERMGLQDAADQAGATGDTGATAGDPPPAAAPTPPAPPPPAPQTQAPARTKADADLAKAAGVDLNDLDDADLADLRAAATADQVRTPAPKTARRLVLETNGNTSNHAITLMLEACDIYGVNPSADVVPRELLAWRFYGGEDDPAKGVTPDAVVIVTGGGLKLKHYDDDDPGSPKDLDTQDRLRRAFGLFKQDPKTKEITVLPIPDDVTLPAAAVNGIGHTDHQYPGGYVKTGGKMAAAEKDKRRAERAKRLGQ